MRRRTRFVLVAHGLTAVSHVVPALALAVVLPWPAALAAGCGVWLLTALRLHRLGHDRPKPRWVTRLIDEPMFVHWGACLFALALFPVALALSPLSGLSLAPSAAVAYGAGFALALWGVTLRRRWVRVTRVRVPVAGLPAAFEGYRIVQLTDLHIGSYDRVDRGKEWARLANEQRADLAVVTGDIVTAGTEFYGDAAAVIGELSAPDGVVATLGNHDQWDADACTRALEARGVTVLRNQSLTLERDGARLHVAGIDDRYAGRDDLDRTLADCDAGAPTVLLSHYPDFFEPAAQRGVALVLSGHTHGGQIGVPFLARFVNVASLSKQRAAGLVQQGKSALYVSAGLGTTGPPLRLGIAPEIAVIELARG